VLSEDLYNGQLVSTAKFILGWDESDGIFVENKSSLHDIRVILVSFCQGIEWRCGRICHDYETQMMFREFIRNFSSFMDNQKMFWRYEK
jgi:hypothetical protein